MPRPHTCTKITAMKRIPLILALTLSACLKDETISGQTTPAEIWHLTKLNETLISTEITLSFPEKGKIAGQAPCNRYFATQTAVLPWFSLGPIGATRRACPELALESRYLQTLAKITMVERLGNTLVLTNNATESLEYRLKP